MIAKKGESQKPQYDYEKRYGAKHTEASNTVRRTVQVTSGQNPLCLCPTCLNIVPLRQFSFTPEGRRKNKRSMEAHHFGYHPLLNIFPLWLRYLPCCSWCHIGRNGDRRRSKMHNRAVWKINRNPDLSRNVIWFVLVNLVWYLVVRLLVVAIRFCTRAKII